MRSFTLALTAVLLGSAAPSLAAPFGSEAASDASPVAHSLGSRGITAIENMPAYLAKREPMPAGEVEAAEGVAGHILPSGRTPVNPDTDLRGALGNALRVFGAGAGAEITHPPAPNAKDKFLGFFRSLFGAEAGVQTPVDAAGEAIARAGAGAEVSHPPAQNAEGSGKLFDAVPSFLRAGLGATAPRDAAGEAIVDAGADAGAPRPPAHA